MFEIGRRAAGDVSVFLLEVVLLQSPHRQGPFAQHVAGHGTLRFAPAKGAFRFALATPGFRGREVDRREHVVAVEPEIPKVFWSPNHMPQFPAINILPTHDLQTEATREV